jgi:lipid A disaccharide synthetase
VAGISRVDFVAPASSGRARAMRAYVDHVLALLPFEPEAHERLGAAIDYLGSRGRSTELARFTGFQPDGEYVREGLRDAVDRLALYDGFENSGDTAEGQREAIEVVCRQ